MARKRQKVSWVSALSLECAFMIGVITIAKPDILADLLASERALPSTSELEQTSTVQGEVVTKKVGRIFPP